MFIYSYIFISIYIYLYIYIYLSSFFSKMDLPHFQNKRLKYTCHTHHKTRLYRIFSSFPFTEFTSNLMSVYIYVCVCVGILHHKSREF